MVTRVRSICKLCGRTWMNKWPFRTFSALFNDVMDLSLVRERNKYFITRSACDNILVRFSWVIALSVMKSPDQSSTKQFWTIRISIGRKRLFPISTDPMSHNPQSNTDRNRNGNKNLPKNVRNWREREREWNGRRRASDAPIRVERQENK